MLRNFSKCFKINTCARGFKTSSTYYSALGKPIPSGLEVTKQQAPNRVKPWSDKQAHRGDVMVGPRFEQTDFSAQPFPQAAVELIYEVPVKHVNARVVSCDGGGGALGHPKVYINLDQNIPMPCGYCGLRYQFDHSH
ncbi:hypothetical protein DSO57_1005910 [Entomophthora muscae]|uniref:Uncharacterized protein n=1 Tax=Entomophthora muscae TaxID=34485 RepID=A0ACC2S9Z6_9FUNG|nr:hypothetical protein DSO57_1005910 [Entomophthora muscae]